MPKGQSARALEWTEDSTSYDTVTVPFEIKAEQFLDFAKEDFSENSLRGDINAITNIKRCIENRLDALLFIFGYYEVAENEKWPFPKKLDLLESLDIKAPQILQRRINLRRIIVEHRYRYPPKHEELQDLIEISELFLEATKIFIERYASSTNHSIEKNGLIKLYLALEIEIGNGRLNVQIFDGSNKPKHFGALIKKLELGITDDEYIDWVRLLMKLAY